MEGTSLMPQQEKLKALKELLPEAFAEGKIDWEKLKATLGEDINFSNERYVLNWAGKSDAFKVLQTPTTKTLIPAKDESINFDTTENIFIEGENLEVLKVLQKSYFGKVKMIYIDPPYNTGNDSFIYPDKFSETKAEYEKRVGDKDEEGYMTKDGMFKKNSKENGQYHSNWLSMMMPRLYLAKNLLTQDGVIFVSIDDNEIHNLRLLMNEIFGEENFVANYIWQKKTGASDAKGIAIITEYILVFSKNILSITDTFSKNNSSFDLNRYKLKDKHFELRGQHYIDNLDRGGLQYSDSLNYSIECPDGSFTFPNGRTEFVNDGWIWKWSKNKVKWGLENDFIEFRKSNSKNSGWSVCYKNYLFVDNECNPIERSAPHKNLIQDILNANASAVMKSIFQTALFDYSKPVELINLLISHINNKNDIILDFFAGSGTTAQAVLELNKIDGGNRKYICVQLPELCDEKSIAYKEGYKSIAEVSKERIRRAGKAIVSGQLLIINEKKAQLEKLVNENTLIKDQEKIDSLQSEINHLQLTINNYDSGFKVLKLADSNFKQWQQIEGKDAKALTEQMQLFIDPVSENATIENMVYEFLLKSGKDLNSKIEKRNEYFVINNSELIMLLESVSQIIIEQVIGEKPMKVIALDKLFKDNDQLKTNTVLQMRDAGIEFKTV
jgi:adenine-specific DNA-methyltransferase